MQPPMCRACRAISTHAPHTRSDMPAAHSAHLSSQFQPTPLIRGATRHNVLNASYVLISTHAPHTRSDTCDGCPIQGESDFNPRPSYEERLRRGLHHAQGVIISTHAPHTRSDSLSALRDRLWRNFNPRPSYEERPKVLATLELTPAFQPTPLIRGATCIADGRRKPLSISTHAPHTRSDAPKPSCA